jgi:membrane protease YdiL (CAAX protease family)
MSNDSSKPAPAAPKAGRFGPVSAVWVTLGAFFGSQLAAGLLIGLAIALSGKKTTDATKFLSDSTAGQFIFILLVELLTLGILFWFIRRRKISRSEIGLGRGPKFSDIGYALLFFLVYFVLLAVILAAVSAVAPDINLKQEQQIGFEAAGGGSSLILVFISLVILPPIVEEIMIRGFLYSGLRRKSSRFPAAVIASLIFGVAHLQLGSGAPPLYVAAIDTFVLSMVLISLRERTGSIWSGMLVHALKNGVAFTALFILHAG